MEKIYFILLFSKLGCVVGPRAGNAEHRRIVGKKRYPLVQMYTETEREVCRRHLRLVLVMLPVLNKNMLVSIKKKRLLSFIYVDPVFWSSFVSFCWESKKCLKDDLYVHIICAIKFLDGTYVDILAKLHCTYVRYCIQYSFSWSTNNGCTRSNDTQTPRIYVSYKTTKIESQGLEGHSSRRRLLSIWSVSACTYFRLKSTSYCATTYRIYKLI